MKHKRLIVGVVIGALVVASVLFFGHRKKEANKVKKIGLVQIVEHPSLNLIRDAFLDEMKQLGYTKDKVDIMLDQANGEPNLLTPIMQKYDRAKVDVIVPIATPTALAAAPYADHIPVIFSAISDPVSVGLVDNLNKPNKGITGTSDQIQVKDILDLAMQFYPKTKSIGAIYNPAELNSVSTMKGVKRYATDHHLTVVETPISKSSELSQAVATILPKVDIVFSPIDNTVASGIDTVSTACMQAKKPYFVSADSMVKDNGFATVGIDYEEVGRETARMVDQVFKGKKIEAIPIKQFTKNLNIYVNKGVADAIGFKIPDELKIKPNYKEIPLKGN